VAAATAAAHDIGTGCWAGTGGNVLPERPEAVRDRLQVAQAEPRSWPETDAFFLCCERSHSTAVTCAAGIGAVGHGGRAAGGGFGLWTVAY
jgi:hypothetical protein